MSSLQNRQIIVGISGGVAAYKAAEWVRLLIKAGAKVRVVMTTAAQEFITPLTLQAVSGYPVHIDLLDTEAEMGMGHIELARWADLVVITPASANIIARLAQGKGDDLLTTLCLCTRAPIAVAPAMNQNMWGNRSVQDNIAVLERRKIMIWGPDYGSQACGDIGLGRMLEPQELIAHASRQFATGLLSGKKVVITAGPTKELIDPVRYISNFSSGKMGYALARACMDAGAEVILISGEVALATPERVTLLPVQSALDMLRVTLDQIEDADIFIASAAVADYRPLELHKHKIKKGKESELTLKLTKNPDILSQSSKIMRQTNSQGKMVIGFAAETQDIITNARIKLKNKGADLIIANDVSRGGIGFNQDSNEVTMVWPDREEVIERASKSQLAVTLVEKIADSYNSIIEN